MTVSVKHNTLTTESPTGAGGTVGATEWNEAHEVQMAADRLLGRTTAGTGAVEEISIGTGLSMAAGVLSASGGGGSSGWTQIATSGTLSGTSYTFNALPSTYADLLLVLEGVSHNNGTNAAITLAVGKNTGAFTGGNNVTSSTTAATVFNGGIFIPGYTKLAGVIILATATNSGNTLEPSSASAPVLKWLLTGGPGIYALQLAPSGGSFDAGTATLYGR